MASPSTDADAGSAADAPTSADAIESDNGGGNRSILRRLKTIPRNLTVDEVIAHPIDLHSDDNPPATASPSTVSIDYDAMISYAWADKEIVRPLVEKLEKMSVRVWIDTKNMGDYINESMMDGIRRSAMVVSFFSDSYVASHNCKLEIKFANDIRKPILPVRLSGSDAVVYSAAAFITAGQLCGVTPSSHELLAARILKTSHTGLEAITIPTSNVELTDGGSNILGKGSFATVFKGQYHGSVPVAVKSIKLTHMSEESRFELINEAAMLQRSRHPFIIGFLGVLQVDSGFSLVLEFASLGSLHDYYKNPTHKATSLHQRVLILYQVSAGMAHLHDKLKIMHNDLKSPNILLTHHFVNGPIVSKITDFGLSKIKTESRTLSRLSPDPPGGTPSQLWIAPERRRFRPKLSSANDVYSFAVVMTEVVSWIGVYGIPWEGMDATDAHSALQTPDKRESLLQGLGSSVFKSETAVGAALFQLFKQCWSLDMAERPRFESVCLELKSLADQLETKPASHEASNLIPQIMLVSPKTWRDINKRKVASYFAQEPGIDTARTLLPSTSAPEEPSLNQTSIKVEMKLSEPSGTALLAALRQDWFASLLNLQKRRRIREILADVTHLDLYHNSAYHLLLLLPSFKIASDFKLFASGARLIAEVLEGSTSLQSLDLRWSRLGDEGVKTIADALRANTTLQIINFRSNGIGNEGAKAVAAALQTSSSLLNVGLRANEISEEGAIAMGNALKTNNTLQSIDLYNNKIGPEGAKTIASALKTNTSMCNLNLLGNKIAQEGASALAEALLTNKTLQVLDLTDNEIGDGGAKAVANVLKFNCHLQRVSLRYNQISPDGAKAIADALRINTTLKSIDLSFNNFGKEGASAIAEARKVNRSVKVFLLI
ncbi:hypothetical protein DFJ73DRAFT_58091 [Zopfochytrium polystomum]|nr:hypothetical protein DFJ73DRAFT_58091 [Zopfochytrium polystomum]